MHIATNKDIGTIKSKMSQKHIKMKIQCVNKTSQDPKTPSRLIGHLTTVKPSSAIHRRGLTFTSKIISVF